MTRASLLATVLVITTCLFTGRCQNGNLDRCPTQLNRGAYLKAFRDKCYDFVTYDDRTWNTAKMSCEGQGGSLAIITDQSTQDFILATIKNVGYTEKGMWIGLTDSENEGSWKWVKASTASYSNWERDHGGILGFAEDCALLRSVDGKWIELPCGVFWDTYGFICEYDMMSTTSSLPVMPKV
ncbi:perlucin-like protein [Haliotis cracherodii]|uniref:perlucin-like protein n=1 Tax=Haliotis cracherodii TaxID=6455 RepID=UPI0039EB1CAB